MNSALGYLLYRFFYRFWDFFHHWYADASRAIFHGYVLFLERLDRRIALRITVRYFFQPLYKDYSIPGRFFGFVFRSVRIAIGVLVYTVCIAIFALSYLVWLLIPIVIILYVGRHLA